jgi:hypothetical protein
MGSGRAHNLMRLRAREGCIGTLSRVSDQEYELMKCLNARQKGWTRGTIECRGQVGVNLKLIRYCCSVEYMVFYTIYDRGVLESTKNI